MLLETRMLFFSVVPIANLIFEFESINNDPV